MTSLLEEIARRQQVPKTQVPETGMMAIARCQDHLASIHAAFRKGQPLREAFSDGPRNFCAKIVERWAPWNNSSGFLFSSFACRKLF